MKLAKPLTLVVFLFIFQASASLTWAQTGAITGTVTSDDTEGPIPGANVVIEGSSQGAATNAQGEYTISGVEPGMYTLVASFVGYGDESKESVEVQADQTIRVDFAMQQEAAGLNEVVVIGYGEQQRRDLTGSVASVSTAEIQDVPVTRVEEALQGRVAGAQVMRNSGVPGGEITIRIRGTNSINAGSDPLFVIDGFPGAGDLNSINPENIASIQVLKGPSATAIYGARGAGGVVLIETKQGSAGEPRVNFDASYGFQTVANTLDLLNATQYARLVNDARIEEGAEPQYENPSSLSGTDWQDQIFRTAPRQDYGLSVSGGSEDVQYLISGNYLDEGGTIIGSYFNRGNLRVNLNGDVSDKFTVGSNLTLSRTGTNQIGGQRARNALIFRPTLPVRRGDGSYATMTIPQLETENPVAEALEPRVDNTAYRGIGQVFAEYSILEALDLRVNLGGNYAHGENKEYIPTTLKEGLEEGGIGTISQEKTVEWINENTLTYDRSFGERHDVNLLGGFTIQNQRNESTFTGSRDFITEDLGYNDLSAGVIGLVPQSGVTEWTLLSSLFRANYTLNDKYLFTATARYDGSSKFGAGNRWGFFPSGAVAWRLSEEGFLEDVSSLNNLKLRASYGITGNQDIGAYSSLAALGTSETAFGIDQSRRIGVGPESVGNNNLKWETTSQLNLGLDAALLNNRLSMTANYYHKRTTDLLLSESVPAQTGFSEVLRNVGSVQNIGTEFSLNTQNLVGDFSWSTSANITANQNKVLELGQNESFFPGVQVGYLTTVNAGTIIVKEGEELGAINGYIFEGLFQSQEEIENSAQPNAELGTPRYRDLNNDGAISREDRTILGSGQPSLYGGIRNTFSYKGFDLSIFLRGTYGGEILNSTRIELESLNGVINNLASVLDRWTPENRDTNVPKARATGYSYRVSTKYVEDGSYLRLQNVTLGYELPEPLLRSLSLRSARVYLTGTNLYTLTGYSGYDPEVNFQGGSNLAYSIDYEPFPTPRTVTLGINLGF